MKKGLNISKVIFYTKDFNENINYPVDVILSPQFYWIKKIDIPIKNIFQAKRIAKNIFDLEGDYIFDAFKIGDTYYAIAIDKNLNLKIDKKYIKSLRIAQKELYDYDCIEVSDKYTIKKIDDIFFCFLNDGNCPKIEKILKNIKLSNYSLSLDVINLDKSSLIIIFISFVFIFSYFIIGIISYKKDLNLIERKKTELSKYNLPLTSFQLDAIYNNLKEIDYSQKKLRKDLEIFSRTPLRKNEEYIKLVFDKNFYVKIKTSNNLDNYFKKYFKIIKSDFKNQIYTAKLAYE
jgi:hypothetical protein